MNPDTAMRQAILALLSEHGPLAEPELVGRLELRDPRDIIRFAEVLVFLRCDGLTTREAYECHCSNRPRHHHCRIRLNPAASQHDLASPQGG